ncbi:MAG: hypothetical protein AB7O52_18955 [Planctomycetota bacterium]
MTSVETRLLARMLRQQHIVPEDQLRLLLSQLRDHEAVLQELLRLGLIDDEWVRAAEDHIRRRARRSSDEENDLLRGDRSFGQIALARGWADLNQVEGAILEQQRLRRVNLRFRMGEILVRNGVLSAEQVRTILSQQGYAVQSCSNCARMVNYPQAGEASEGHCGLCGGELSEAKFLDAVRPDAAHA